MEDNRRFSYRSLFWPILLIGIGAIWLLANMEMIPRNSWWTLLRFWPIFLIAIGLDLIFGRRSALLGGIIGAGLVGIAILILLAAPSLNLLPSVEVITERFSEPIGAATSANVELDLSVGRNTISALSTSTNLIEVEVTHFGNVSFDVDGETKKTIRLRSRAIDFGFNFIDFFDEERELSWEIALSPDVPLYLDVQGGVGDSTIDVSDLLITGMKVDSGVGNMDLSFPAMEDSYSVDIEIGVGDVEITIMTGTQIDLDVSGGVGNLTINVPSDAAVHVDAETGVGSIRLSSAFKRISGDDDQIVGEEGVWETSGFAEADQQITITFEGGVGDLTVR
jgi:hypothetical protein